MYTFTGIESSNLSLSATSRSLHTIEPHPGATLEEYTVLVWVLTAVLLLTAFALGGVFFYLTIASAAFALWLTLRRSE